MDLLELRVSLASNRWCRPKTSGTRTLMAYVRAVERQPVAANIPVVAAREAAGVNLILVLVVASDDEQEWIDSDDVTGKSELQRIYPSWIGWVNMAALSAAICGVITLVWGWLGNADIAFLVGSILFTIGLMIFLLVTRTAARIRFGAAKHPHVSSGA